MRLVSRQFGNRRCKVTGGVDTNIRDAFAGYRSAAVSDATLGAGVMDPGVRQLSRRMHIVGRAVTVWVPAGALSVRKEAIAGLQPGDVLVVAAGASSLFAVLGERLCKLMADRGAAGVS